MEHFRTFDSFEEMQKALADNERRADEAVKPWQSAIKVGDFYVRIEPEYKIAIFGEVIESEYEEDRQRYSEPGMENHRLARCHSLLCPEGELGDIHVVSVHALITKGMFEEARDADWGSAVIHDWLLRGWQPPE